MKRYKIVRMFFKGRKRTMRRGLTLVEAQAHCRDKETSSSTCQTARMVRYTQRRGPWFDGYDRD